MWEDCGGVLDSWMIVKIVLWTLFGNKRNYLLFYPLVCYTYYRKFLINLKR